MSAATQVPVRRFEPGASGMGSDLFLKDRGWSVVVAGPGHYRVFRTGAGGRPKTLTSRQLVDFLDELRIADGREPIRRRNAK